ncbi:MAG: helix-turn-helix transcriptional regulator [Pseudomonadota bacterium]
MLSHERIWTAIDELAASQSLTPSGLAKRAGLDSTTFNKSKRVAADGRLRWPSTESLSKILQATNVSIEEFIAFVSPPSSTLNGLTDRMALGTTLHDDTLQLAYDLPAFSSSPVTVPLVGMAQAGAGGFFDDAGFPAGEGWDQISLPGSDGLGENAYALEISGDSMLPLYRAGDRIIVSPSATVRKGDRVVVKTRDGEVMAKILKRKTSIVIEVASLNPEHADREIPASDVEWIARIVWASQ